MASLIDRTGITYGRLTVIERDDTKPPASKGRRVYWFCKCACGATVSRTGHSLQSGDTISCGCAHRDMMHQRRTHGQTKTPTYNSWRAMRERCGVTHNASAPIKYPDVTVCDRWIDSFENFLADMGPRPDGLTLDRIDSFGGYSPENCRWADGETQSRNRKSNRLWKGAMRGFKEIAEMEGVKRTSLQKRVNVYGDTLAQAVSYLQSLT